MLKIGLTGNIGSGKTLISEIFSTLGIPVYYADMESKKFLDDSIVIDEIISTFGENILTTKRQINKVELASIVFSDPEKLLKLNEILHPRVMLDFMQWCKSKKQFPYLVHEAAIIYESGVEKFFNKIIHVSCPKDIAIERVMKRDNISSEQVLQRMRFQMDDEIKSKLADFVIHNDGKEMILPQVIAIHEYLNDEIFFRNPHKEHQDDF